MDLKLILLLLASVAYVHCIVRTSSMPMTTPPMPMRTITTRRSPPPQTRGTTLPSGRSPPPQTRGPSPPSGPRPSAAPARPNANLVSEIREALLTLSDGAQAGSEDSVSEILERAAQTARPISASQKSKLSATVQSIADEQKLASQSGRFVVESSTWRATPAGTGIPIGSLGGRPTTRRPLKRKSAALTEEMKKDGNHDDDDGNNILKSLSHKKTRSIFPTEIEPVGYQEDDDDGEAIIKSVGGENPARVARDKVPPGNQPMDRDGYHGDDDGETILKNVKPNSKLSDAPVDTQPIVDDVE